MQVSLKKKLSNSTFDLRSFNLNAESTNELSSDSCNNNELIYFNAPSNN